MTLPRPIPVDQMIDHNPPHAYGDCTRACIATLLGIPLCEAPYLPPDSSWLDVANKFLEGHGLALVSLDWDEGAVRMSLAQNVYFLLYGKSPRGHYGHAVVAHVQDGQILTFHDPHASRAGLLPDRIDGMAFLTPIFCGNTP